MIAAAAPVPVQASTASSSPMVNDPYSLEDSPTNTPVRLPRNDFGGIPACSSACQVTSSRTRCCGSIAAASTGVMPKKPASKPATSSMNPPRRGRSCQSSAGAKSAQRPSGRSRIASRPPSRSRQKSCGEFTPPGNRQPSPTIAIGSSRRVRGRGISISSSSSPSPDSRTARAAIVGFCHTSVGDSRLPSRCPSSAASSTASREDKPNSCNGRSASTRSAGRPLACAIRSTSHPRISASLIVFRAFITSSLAEFR